MTLIDAIAIPNLFSRTVSKFPFRERCYHSWRGFIKAIALKKRSLPHALFKFVDCFNLT